MGNPQLVAVDGDTFAFPQQVQDTLDVRIQTRLQQQYGYGAAKIDAYRATAAPTSTPSLAKPGKSRPIGSELDFEYELASAVSTGW